MTRRVLNNRANLNGGGLFISVGKVVLKNGSAIEENTAGANGGGIFNRALTQCALPTRRFAKTKPMRMAALSSTSVPDLTLVNSRVNGNVTHQRGGGVYNSGKAGPGGGTLTAGHRRPGLNQAQDAGGGIFNTEGGEVTLDAQSAVARNEPDNCVGTSACG